MSHKSGSRQPTGRPDPRGRRRAAAPPDHPAAPSADTASADAAPGAGRPPSSPAARDPRVARTTARVLDAVRDLLLTEGPDAITHARVADAAGVGRATLYRHWPEPTALLREALGHARFPAAARTGDVRADLVALLEALRAAFVEGPLAPVLAMLMARATRDPAVAALCHALTGEGHAATAAVLRDGIAAGVLRADLDVERAVAALGGPVFYRAFVRREPLGAAELPGIVDDALRAAWHTP